MGLDNYAARAPDGDLTDEDIEAFEKADIYLCDGKLMGSPSSFRGKLYDFLIDDITGESLYEHWIPPETVKRMHQALMQCDSREAVRGDYHYDYVEAEIINLRKFFRVCAERNLGLVGWW